MCELAAAAAASAAAAAAAAVAVAGFISNVGIAASVAMPAAADPDRPVAETGIPHHGVTSLAHAIVFAPKVPDMCPMMEASAWYIATHGVISIAHAIVFAPMVPSV